MLVVCPYTPQASWAAARTFKTASADSQDIATALVCEVSLIFARLGDLTIFSQFSLFCLILSISMPGPPLGKGGPLPALPLPEGRQASGWQASLPYPYFNIFFCNAAVVKEEDEPESGRGQVQTSSNVLHGMVSI